MYNPFLLVWVTIRGLPLLPELCRAWLFLATMMVGFTLIATQAAEEVAGRRTSGWMAGVIVAALAAWSAWLLYLWLPGGPVLPVGWRGAVEPFVMLVLFGASLWAMPGRWWIGVTLLAAVTIDYKVYGTDRVFTAVDRDVDRDFAFWNDARLRGHSLAGLDDAAFVEMMRFPDYRVALEHGPHSTDARHYGYATPQGVRPLSWRGHTRRL